MLRKLIVDLLLPAVFLAMLALLLKWLIVPSSCDDKVKMDQGVYGAPMPLPKTKLAPVLVRVVDAKHYSGTWKMVWGKGDWDVTLSSFGSYLCTNKGGSTWVGTWQVDTAGNWAVTENWVCDNGQSGSKTQWTAEWAADDRGNFNPANLKGIVRRPDGSISPTKITLVKIK